MLSLPTAIFVPLLLTGSPLAPHSTAADGDVWTLERMREVAAGIQGQIAELRGLDFERGVKIELADPAELLNYARRTLEADGGAERMRREGEVLQLLGLLPGDVDYLDLTTKVLVEQVGGFYDPSSETFYVMRTIQPDLVRVVIAHEFTHALDDQHYDLDGTARALRDNDDAALAYHAVVEGSGMEIMFEWARRFMTPAQLARMAEAQAELPTEVVGSAPPVIWKPLVALYYQGQAFLRRQRRASPLGAAARASDIDRAFQEPPRSTEQVIHPLKYWNPEHRDEPQLVELDLSHLPEGILTLEESVLGELNAALVTTPYEERGGLSTDMKSLLGLRFTNDAASGWGGDRFALLGRDAARLLVWETRWDTIQDADEFAGALSDLVEGIEEYKSRASGYDPERSGFRLQRKGSDGVRVLSWSGFSEDEAERLAGAVVSRVADAPDMAREEAGEDPSAGGGR